MTDKYNALIIALEADIRDDEAADLITAICQLRGVLGVSGNVADTAAYIAEERDKGYYQRQPTPGIKE